MKKVIDVLIGNTFVTPAGGTVAVQSLTAGQLAVYDQDRDGLVTTADFKFNFAQADTDYNSRSSLEIIVKNITRVRKKAYQAATSQVKTFTIDASDAVDLTNYRIDIYETRDVEYLNKPGKSYFAFTDSTATETEIATQLAANINADKTANYTASSAAGVLTVTAKNYSVIFDIIPKDGFTSASVVAQTTAPDQGCGTYALVKQAEDLYKGYKGFLNKIEFSRPPRSYADSTKTYVQYIIEHAQNIEDPVSGTIKLTPVQTIIFIDSTATLSITALDTLFNTSLGISFS